MLCGEKTRADQIWERFPAVWHATKLGSTDPKSLLDSTIQPFQSLLCFAFHPREAWCIYYKLFWGMQEADDWGGRGRGGEGGGGGGEGGDLMNDSKGVEIVPYFTLPAHELKDVIAPSCYSCFDYTNRLADLVVLSTTKTQISGLIPAPMG